MQTTFCSFNTIFGIIMSLTGIIPLTVVPLRAEPSDRSEMVSQMLFGEKFDILESNEKWFRVLTHYDQFIGWIDKKQAFVLDTPHPGNPQILVVSNNDSVYLESKKGRQYLFDGSEIWDNTDNLIRDQKHLSISGAYSFKPLRLTEMIDKALTYQGTPYLWGGRTKAGIDCSGFSQLMFKLMNIGLPRDAWMQADHGMQIDYSEVQAGDLAFFKNEAQQIVHVGLILDQYQILHASGWVRLDMLKPDGILNLDKGLISHNLHSIKRIIQ